MSADKNPVKVQHHRQKPAMCGPASLKILLSYFEKNSTEDQLALMAGTTKDAGTEHEGLVEAIKSIDGYVFVKDNGTLEELEHFAKIEKLPVIIGWFDHDEDHYSVVVNVTDKNIILVDPGTDTPERWLDRATFNNIWFDFVGKENKIASWGWYMVVTFDKRKFPIPGGHYY